MRPRSNFQAWTETDSMKRKMSNTENIPNSFLDNARPIFLILRIFGRFPFVISGNKVQSFSKTSPIVLYSTLLSIIAIYLASQVLEVLTYRFATSESYKDSLRSLMAISFLLHFLLIPLTDILLAPAMIKYINLWHKYECQCSEEFASFPNKFLVQFLSYAALPVSIYSAYHSAYEVCGNNFFYSMVYFPLIFGFYQYTLLWMLCQLYLVRQIRKLTEIVISEGLQNRVERIRKCWLLLSELASYTGYSVGLTLISIGMTCFVVLITYGYCFFTSLLDPEGCVEWLMGFWAICQLFFFYFVFNSADRATKEIGRNFYLVVFHQKFSELDEENLNQVVLLLTTFSLHPPTIRIAGLLGANKKTFVSFISNTLTYLIVLIQFKT